MTTTKADPIREIAALCDPYAWADVTGPWARRDFNIYIDARIKPRLSGQVTAGSIRADLLDRADELIGALAEAHWVLEEPPEFVFTGSLHRGRWTTDTKVSEAPKEHGIGLTVRLQVRRGGPAQP